MPRFYCTGWDLYDIILAVFAYAVEGQIWLLPCFKGLAYKFSTFLDVEYQILGLRKHWNLH